MSDLYYDLSGKRVWVAGHNGMVGQALLRRLEREGVELLISDRDAVDLRDQAGVRRWMDANRPDCIFLAAAKVGGILANDSYPADFLYDNLMIATNVIEAAHRADVERLIFLGSSCIYPKHAPQPIPEDALMSGPLEPTNEWYAHAKIAGIKLCQAYRRQHGRDYISVQPTNLYGPGDSYDLANSHVIPALIQKAHAAKAAGEDGIEIWGSGEVWREFMHVDDCADGLVFLAQRYNEASPINLGTGEEVTIADAARAVMRTVGVSGELRHDRSKPDGTPRKLMDSTRLRAMGWVPTIPLEEGLKDAYQAYLTTLG